MSRRNERAFLVFSVWCIAGLFLDGWSHNHHKPETFFTPWHAVLYSGFLVATLYSFTLGRREETITDRLTIVGFALFSIGMVGDFAWHQAFGIERGIEALLSPTHLTLMTGGLLLVSAPARLAPSPNSRTVTPTTLVSITTSTALIAFFTMYFSAFRGNVATYAVHIAGRGGYPEQVAISGVATILVTNALLVGAVAWTVRRWSTPRGAFIFILTAVALAMSSLDGFARLPLVLAALLGGLAADVAIANGFPRLAPIVTPLVMWPAWFAELRLTGTMAWPANLWLGAVFLAVLTGVGVRALGEAIPGRADLETVAAG
jgi:hypothetical protein